MNVTGKSLRSAFICLCALLLAPLQLAKAEGRSASYREKLRQVNDIAVTIVGAGFSSTSTRFADDIRRVVNDLQPGGVRVLPVLGVGGLQTVNDVLFLKSIDMGIIDADDLRLLKERDPLLYAGVEQHIQYITKLYNAEFHVLASNDIKSYDDLRGRKVNFGLKDSQTEVSAGVILNALQIPVVKTNYDVIEAINQLRKGKISAMIVLTGAPQAALLRLVKKSDGLHFLPLDRESLPNHNLSALFSDYLPAELTHEEYPNLIPEGTTVPTIANRALLVTYAWPEDSIRYKKIANFVDAFFDKIDQFHTAAQHPKWKEVNLAAEMPGWTRFKPAADWLAAHQNPDAAQTRNDTVDQSGDGAGANASTELKLAFERFIENYAASSGRRRLSSKERALLFSQFMRYVESQKTGQVAR